MQVNVVSGADDAGSVDLADQDLRRRLQPGTRAPGGVRIPGWLAVVGRSLGNPAPKSEVVEPSPGDRKGSDEREPAVSAAQSGEAAARRSRPSLEASSRR